MTAELSVPDEAWEDILSGVEGSAPRLCATATLDVGTTRTTLYLAAIAVTDEDGTQEAVNAADGPDLEMLGQVTSVNGPFETVTIGGAGDHRTFVVFATT